MLTSLVTGGTGFLGSNLCSRLLREGRRVICLDNNYTGRMENIAELMGDENFRFVEHDVCNPFDPGEHVDEIYNLACPASPPAYQGRHSIDTTRTCVLGAINMLELAKKYGLSDFLESYPPQLSGGMRQRAALIRTLATEPDILLLDEPFSALDYQTRLNVCGDVASIIRGEQKTALLITHDISEAISLADRILVLTKRPARVAFEHELDFGGETRPIKRREMGNFGAWFEILWKELNV